MVRCEGEFTEDNDYICGFGHGENACFSHHCDFCEIGVCTPDCDDEYCARTKKPSSDEMNECMLCAYPMQEGEEWNQDENDWFKDGKKIQWNAWNEFSYPEDYDAEGEGKTRTFKITDIWYDTYDEEAEEMQGIKPFYDKHGYKQSHDQPDPSEMTITLDEDEGWEDRDLDMELADAVSDESGFMVYHYNWDEISPESKSAEGLEFTDWAKQESKTHGKTSLKDWADHEIKTHGGKMSFQNWAKHEDKSHIRRYGAEEYDHVATMRKLVAWLKENDLEPSDIKGFTPEGHVILKPKTQRANYQPDVMFSAEEGEYWEYHVYVGDSKYGDMFIVHNARDFGTKEEAIKAAHEVSKDERGKGQEVYVIAELHQFWEDGEPMDSYEEGIYTIGEDGEVLRAENWGGDPKGQLATALRNARIKAKQPKKPLKIEKLDAEMITRTSYACSDCGREYEQRRGADECCFAGCPHTWELDKTRDWEDGMFTMYVSCRKCGTTSWIEGHADENSDSNPTPTFNAETSGQWEIGEQLEEAQMNAENYRYVKPVPISHSGGGHKWNGYYAIKGYEEPTADGFTYRILSSPGTKDWYRVYVYDTEKMFQNKSRRLNPSGKMVGSSNPASHLIGSFPRLDDAKRALVFRMIQDEQYHHILSDGNLNWLLHGKNPGSRKWKAEKGIDTFTQPFEESSLDSGTVKKVLVGLGIGALALFGYNKWK